MEQSWGDVRGAHRLHVPHARISIIRPFSSYDWFRDKDYLTEQYVLKQKSTAQIAREIGCARSTVVKFLLEFGVELSKDGLPSYQKSQIAYGEKLYGGSVVPHLGERRVVATFMELRCEGRSYGEIAWWANQNGVPTKNRTGRWDRRTIFQILRRNGAGY